MSSGIGEIFGKLPAFAGNALANCYYTGDLVTALQTIDIAMITGEITLTSVQYLQFFNAYKTLMILASDGDEKARECMAKRNAWSWIDEYGEHSDRVRARSEAVYPQGCNLEEILAQNRILDEAYAETVRSNPDIFGSDVRGNMADAACEPSFSGDGSIQLVGTELKEISVGWGRYRMIPYSRSIATVKAIMRKDVLGKTGRYSSNPCAPTWCQIGEELGEGGWKIHVSATPTSAGAVARVVLPRLNRCGASYKYVAALHPFRLLICKSRYMKGSSQAGKYIAVYPKDDAEAGEIARDLDIELGKAIRRGELSHFDFITCVGDIQLGDSGGLSARWAPSFHSDHDYECRGLPMIVEEASPVQLDLNYEHPFGIRVAYCGVDLPKRVADWKRFGLFYTADEFDRLRVQNDPGAAEFQRTLARGSRVVTIKKDAPARAVRHFK
jgi:hypothetical protein